MPTLRFTLLEQAKVEGGEEMKNLDINKSSLGISTEALGFFLAGIFVLNNSLDNWQITNWVLLISGSVLSLYGVILLFNLIFSKLNILTNIFKPFLVIIILSIGGAQLAIIIATYGTLFKLMSIIFFLLFVYAITYTSRSVFQNRKQLWTIFITMLVIGFVQFFLVNNRLSWDRWDLYFILLFEVIIMSLIIKQTRKLKNNMVASSRTE